MNDRQQQDGASPHSGRTQQQDRSSKGRVGMLLLGVTGESPTADCARMEDRRVGRVRKGRMGI